MVARPRKAGQAWPTSRMAGRVRRNGSELAVLTGTRLKPDRGGAPHRINGRALPHRFPPPRLPPPKLVRRDGQVRELHHRVVLGPETHRAPPEALVAQTKTFHAAIARGHHASLPRDRERVPGPGLERRHLHVLEVAPLSLEEVVRDEAVLLSAHAEQIAVLPLGIELEEEAGRGIDLSRKDAKAHRSGQVLDHRLPEV